MPSCLFHCTGNMIPRNHYVFLITGQNGTDVSHSRRECLSPGKRLFKIFYMFDHRLMEFCPESRKYIIGNILLQWLDLFLNSAMILLIAHIIQELYVGTLSTGMFLFCLGGLAAVVPLRWLTTRLASRMSYLASMTVKKKLREAIYRKLLVMGNSYRDHVTTAELVQESVEGVEQLESYFGLYVPQFFYAFLAPLTLFVLFLKAGSWKTGLVLLIAVPLIPGAIMMVQKIAKRILSKYWGQYTNLGSAFLENLQGMTTLKTYQADEFKNRQMNVEAEKFRAVTMKVLTMQLNSVTIMDFVAYGGAALGIILAVNEFHRGNVTLFAAVFMILLSAEFFLPMRRLGSYFHVAMNGLAASDRIFAFLNTEVPEAGTKVVTSPEIAFHDVSFSYDGETDAVSHLTMKVSPSMFLGITGESGSGKSTIASLIRGTHKPSSGTITVGGIPIEEIRPSSLADTVTFVGTGSVFFKGTVRENLQIVRPDAEDAALNDVLEQCGLTGEITPDTVLQENAANLSGGQRQRLALCRALLHDTPVFIFDEAASNIDIESEELIRERILKLAKKKTVIMISHRLANLVSADWILCMDHGEARECGTHEQLLELDGTYASLWNTQNALEHYGKEDA